MAEGPRLPRKSTGIARTNDALRAVAYQIGTLVAVERNRRKLTQTELGAIVNLDQVAISRVENGQALSWTGKDDKVDALFNELGLGANSPQANFVKWWRDNN